MSIEHDFFGILGADDRGEVYWSDTVENGNEEVSVDLMSPDESAVNEDALDIAAAMIGSIENVDNVAREGLVAELSSPSSSTVRYIESSFEDLDDEIMEDAIIWDSGDRQIDFLRSLRLQTASFFPHHAGDEEHFVVLDYSISPDDSETSLLVTLDVNTDVVAVEISE